MDLLTLGRVLLRRWYVVVPVIALTAVAAVLVAMHTPSRYEASGWLALETPELSPGDLPSSVVDVQGLADDIVADLPTDEVSVRQVDESTFEIAASSAQADEAERLVTRVADDLAAAVTSVQDGPDIPVSQRLQLRQITPSVVAEQQPDGSFVARTMLFLDNPAATANNPYGANASTSRLLEVAISGNAGQAHFEELVGPNFDFDVILQQRDAAPLLQIVTLGPEQDRVLDAFYDVRDMLATELDVRQERAQVPPAARVTLGVVDAPLEVTDVSPPVSRATAGVAGLGVLLAVGLAIALESLTSRRRRPAEDRELPSPAAAEPSEDAVDAPAAAEPSEDAVDAPAAAARADQVVDAPVMLGWEEPGDKADVVGPDRGGEVPIVFTYAQWPEDTRVVPQSAGPDEPDVVERAGAADHAARPESRSHQDTRRGPGGPLGVDFVARPLASSRPSDAVDRVGGQGSASDLGDARPLEPSSPPEPHVRSSREPAEDHTSREWEP